MSNQEKDIDDDYSQVDIALDAVEEGEGVVDSINPGKGLRKIGFGVVIKMVGGGGRKFKIGKGGLTDAMLSGIKEKNYSNLPKVGTHVKYKYCALNRCVSIVSIFLPILFVSCMVHIWYT